MAAFWRNGLAIDKQQEDGAGRLEDVACCHGEVGPLAKLKRAQTNGEGVLAAASR